MMQKQKKQLINFMKSPSRQLITRATDVLRMRPILLCTKQNLVSSDWLRHIHEGDYRQQKSADSDARERAESPGYPFRTFQHLIGAYKASSHFPAFSYKGA